MTCEYCDDGSGSCLFPYYGQAPHNHQTIELRGGVAIVKEEVPTDEWPENFAEDPDEPGLGMFTCCPMCGDSETFIDVK